jgi:hypothetical protein
MNRSVKTPVHLWIVGGVSALWNAFGAFNYWVTQTRNPAVMAQLTEEQRAFIENAPAWVDASWAFGVWGALAGSLLLLARKRNAVAAFAVSLAGLAVNTLSQLGLSETSPHLDTAGQIALHVLIWAVAIGLLVYSLRMRARGALR